MSRIATFIFSWFFIHSVYAVDAAQQGLEIATEMVNRDSGYQSYSADALMTIQSANGDTAERKLMVKGKEQKDDGDQIITYFQSPRDISGTALLTYSHAIKADDQWLFLPSINRVKRISSNNRSGPFMGSEFAYEDMGSWELQKYRYELLGEKTEDGNTFWLLACYPQYKKSGYSKLIAWIDQTIYQPRKIEYFDRRGAPLKALKLSDYQQYTNKYWRAHTAKMSNLQSKRGTTLAWDNYQLGISVSDRQFKPNQLKFAFKQP
ncbi:MAG: outer membrane lipoprotein-sorting protein [Endozoicomonas sp.]|uniref:outer membrane lipoprotein-sorting protein n=1 Tax=Endozoicomonas sp. TaxID=1892382 RepID=UPI003D9BCE65